MRFHQLDIGAQFEYQGEHYTKSNNLIAVRQDGSQKFMQRSAVVSPVESQASTTETPIDAEGMVSREAVVQAQEKFLQTCMASIKNTSLSKPEQSELAKAFKAASKEFFEDIS